LTIVNSWARLGVQQRSDTGSGDMAIKVTEIKSSGRKGQSWIARDSEHADRIIERRKAQLPAGASVSYTRKVIS
jgi:hypothetical protein